MLRYRDPVTSQERTRSAGTENRREAERAAARWEEELATSPTDAPRGALTWDVFADLYDREHLRSLADTSGDRSILVMDAFARHARPGRLSTITPLMISRWCSHLRTTGLAETTIQSYCGTLHAALSWAVRQGLLAAVPAFPTVQRAKTGHRARVMKGRPLTRAEFVRMLRVAGEVVGDDRRAAWRRYLRGLWLSGLRLSESLDFWWDRPERLSVDFSGRRPMLRVHGDQEKGNADRLLPITPDFAKFLERTPLAERTGPVFPIPRSKAPGELPSHYWVSHVVSAIGRRAGVIVDHKTDKAASAHDLRRSFGARWAPLVMPQVLMELMRHRSIEVTMRYYVGHQAEQTADAVWSAWESRVSSERTK